MSDNEYERFEITDYDLDNEFNINRPRRRQTKHQQIYGIWADDSDNDSEGETSGRRGRRGLGGGSSSKPKDYTAPVNFVAGGIQQAGKKSKIKQLDDGKDVARSDDSDDSDEARPSFGDKQPQLMDNNEDNSTDSSEAEERKEHQQMRSKSFAGMRHNSHIPSGRNVGAWEQHTRGIGAKLLLQMGYEPGKGLGKDLQGIQQPVQAHVRKGRGAIGAYGPETAASIGGQAKPQKEDEDVKEAREFKEQLTKWKKGGVEPREKSKQQRYYYKSVEEVIAKSHKSDHLLSEKLAKQLGNVPVIDMTGPERRVLSGYHALAQTKITPEESLYDEQGGEGKDSSISIFSMPELAHNMALLVSQCEQEIILIDKAKRESEDQQAALEQEQRQLLELVHLERNHMNTLNEVLSRLDQLSENPDLTMTQAEDLFVELQRNYPAEFEEYGMADMAGGVIAPLLRRELADWQPLEQPTLHLEMMKRWRTILQKDEEQLHHQQQQQQSRNVFDPYSSLVWAGVMPSIRTSALAWPPKKHAIMAAFLDAWAPVLPTWVLDSILEKLVLTRLRVGVQEWDPLTDTVPIHSWILPWHGLLGGKLEETVYPQIRSKLGAALEAWLPQDRSARAMLTPWQTAFPEEQLIQFLLRHIIPKLQAVLGEFIINPLQQDLELWHQVWEWHELIPPAYMAQLLDKYFFPRWMQVLVMWLNQSPDYAEISRWYAGWKSMFSESILREPCIKEHLRRALDMLHRATDAVLQPNVVPPPPMPPVPAPVLLAPVMLVDVGSSAQLEFKELVSQKCAELGIIFAPLPGRRELGKQIYRVGKLFCYIDRNVCMMTNASFQNWQPVSLNQLLEQAQTGII